MSLEAITEIREVEERTERAKAEARARPRSWRLMPSGTERPCYGRAQDDAAAALAQALRGAEETAAQRPGDDPGRGSPQTAGS